VIGGGQGAPVHHKLPLLALGLGFSWLEQRFRLSEVRAGEKDESPQGIVTHSDIFYHILSGKAAVAPTTLFSLPNFFSTRREERNLITRRQ
jgi:hypothetical protein